MESHSRKVIPHYFCAGAFFTNGDGELLHLSLPSTSSKDFAKIQTENLTKELKLPKVLAGTFPVSTNPAPRFGFSLFFFINNKPVFSLFIIHPTTKNWFKWIWFRNLSPPCKWIHGLKEHHQLFPFLKTLNGSTWLLIEINKQLLGSVPTISY